MNVFKEMAKCLSFPQYIVYRSSGAGKNFFYLLVLSLIGFLLTVVIGLGMPFINMGGFDEIEKNIPYFNMTTDGELTIDADMYELTDNNELVIIDTVSIYTLDEDENVLYDSTSGVDAFAEDLNDYSRALIVSKKSVVFCDNLEGQSVELEYNDIPVEYLSKINIPSLMELMRKFAFWFVIAALVWSFVRLFFWNIVNAVVSACISSNMGVRNKFGQNYSMALRAYTPIYLVSCLLSAFHISFPFKIVVCLLITGLILSKAIKTIKSQIDEQESMGMDSDLAFRSMYGENNAFDSMDEDAFKDNNI